MKSRKRKRVQQCGTMKYGTAAAQVVAKVFAAPHRSKKARSGGDQETAQLALRRCRNYGRTGNNTRTCRKGVDISSESDASTTYIGSLFDSDEDKDA